MCYGLPQAVAQEGESRTVGMMVREVRVLVRRLLHTSRSACKPGFAPATVAQVASTATYVCSAAAHEAIFVCAMADGRGRLQLLYRLG